MAKRYSFIVSVASICGFVQSIVWLGLLIFGSLIYLCTLSISPYGGTSDFFRVTFAKLYFEGPKCPINGNYLGKFNDDLKNSQKINLLTPDIIFAIIIAKVIFEATNIVLSLLVYDTNKKENCEKKLHDLVLGWSLITLCMSALDAFLTIELLLDMFSLINYLDADKDFVKDPLLGGIQFIPLIFALISCRLIVLWLWNVILAIYFMFQSLLPKKRFSPKDNEKVAQKPVTTQVQPFKSFSTESLRKSSNTNSLPFRKTRSDWDLYSMEAITHFNEDLNQNSPKSFPRREFRTLPAKDEYIFAYTRSEMEEKLSQKENGIINQGYDCDEKSFSDSEAKNRCRRKGRIYDKDERKIKIVKKKPLGKPVQVPNPPPLPTSATYFC